MGESMKSGDTIIAVVRKTSTGATDELLEMGPRSAHELIDWHRIAARNDTDSTTLIEVGLKRNSDEFLIRASNQAALGRTIQTQMDIFATGDYHPYARFSDPDSGDKLELFAYGHVESLDESE